MDDEEEVERCFGQAIENARAAALASGAQADGSATWRWLREIDGVPCLVEGSLFARAEPNPQQALGALVFECECFVGLWGGERETLYASSSVNFGFSEGWPGASGAPADPWFTFQTGLREALGRARNRPSFLALREAAELRAASARASAPGGAPAPRL